MRAWPHLDVLWQIGTEEADGDGEETGCHAICCSDMNWYPCRRATTHTHTHSASCNPDFGLPPYAPTPQWTLTHNATLHHPSIPISIDDVCSRGACWLSEALRSAPLGEARRCWGIWQRDGAQTNGRLVGATTPPTAEGHTATDVLYMSAGCSIYRAAVLAMFTHEALLQFDYNPHGCFFSLQYDFW